MNRFGGILPRPTRFYLIWKDLARFRRIWGDSAGLYEIWPGLDSFGNICRDLIGYGKARPGQYLARLEIPANARKDLARNGAASHDPTRRAEIRSDLRGLPDIG